MSKIFTLPHGPLGPDATPQDFTGDYVLGIRAVETTQRFIYGTRHLTWDGRVFKYSNAVASCYSYHGAAAAEDAALSWTTNAVPTYAGDRSCTVAVGSRAVDDLAGGYLMINDHSSTDTTWLFGIVGNEASVSTTTIIYLDGAIPAALTTDDDFEVFENPYRELSEATNSYAAWVGVPANSASATYKLWTQTWGPAYISPGEDVDDPGADTRTLRWGSNASLFTESSKPEAQIAGFILNQGSANIAGPLIMLKCST